MNMKINTNTDFTKLAKKIENTINKPINEAANTLSRFNTILRIAHLKSKIIKYNNDPIKLAVFKEEYNISQEYLDTLTSEIIADKLSNN